MSNASLILSAATVTLDPASASEGGSPWIQLFAAGRAVMRDGRIADVGDEATMRAIVAATAARAGSTELVIDYDHQSIFGSVPGVGGRAPAAGWIKALEVRPDGIWARVEWTTTAASAIKALEYRYVSPVFYADDTGVVKILVNAGLTNNPALDLEEVKAASAKLSPEQDPAMKPIAQALGLAEDATEDQIIAAIRARDTTLAAVAAAAQTQASGDGLVAAVAGAFAQAKMPDPTRFVPIEALTAANAKIIELTTGASADKAKAAVDAAIAAGKIAPAQKDWALGYASTDLAAFESFVASAPAIVSPGLKAPTERKPVTAGLDATDLEVCRAMGLDPAAYLKTRDTEETL